MANEHVIQRLSAIRDKLWAMHSGGSTMATATRGKEREAFVSEALSSVIAPPFRIESGDITDHAGERSGQLDTVIEFSSSVSFPMAPGLPRLFLAEGVCAVVEVKSDLSAQWEEVEATYHAVSKLDRNRLATMTARSGRFRISSDEEPSKIPVYAVGYRGWKKPKTLIEKSAGLGLAGALILETPMFYSAETNRVTSGSRALFDFFVELSTLATAMLSAAIDYDGYVS